MTSITERLVRVRAQIREAERAAGRPQNSVQLLAVSKTRPASDIVEACQAGQRDFGENYLQEALQKQQELKDYAITWHFIGPIQSNKTRAIASNFDWVHSVDRLKIASRLSDQRPLEMGPLNVCLQVNISSEPTKSGIMLADLAQMIEQVRDLPNIVVRGVMAIPEHASDYQQQCKPYRALYNAVSALNRPELDTLSFGMSDDLTAAIAEGATIVRIGTALFGPRIVR